MHGSIGSVGSVHVCWGHRFFTSLILAGVMGLVATAGCTRTMLITQDPYVNTAMHLERIPKDRTGDPLEVNIVCIYPRDLEKPANHELRPDSGITSALWYKKRPALGGDEPGKFDLPPDQIYLFTDAPDSYGKKVGPRLKGAKADGKSVIKVKGGIAFSGPLHNRRSVIYVFARFLDGEAKVLRVAPAKWDPPGDFREDLTLTIGVRDPQGRAEQYIENTTKRHYHKSK